jgi:tetratricopeptide (TPR) repeat protein
MSCPACQTPDRQAAPPGATHCATCGAALPGRMPAGILGTLAADNLFQTPGRENTRVGGPPFELRPRFVGREPALHVLAAAFAAAPGQGKLGFVAVVGPPGTGKTRLVKEAARVVKQAVPQVRFLHASAGRPEALPYAAFVRILQARFGIGDQETPEDAQRKIAVALGEVFPAGQAKSTEVGHLLLHLLSVGFPGSPMVDPLAEAGQKLEARTFIAIKRFLAADAARAPIILAIDDVDEAYPETINLIHYLAVGLAGAPILLIAIARPGLNDRFPAFGEGEVAAQRLELGLLEPDDAESLFRELLRSVEEPIPEALVAHARRLGESPRTLLELARLLLESAVIVRSERTRHGWRIDADRLARTELPTQPEEVTLLRLRQMPALDRDLLEKAAACGETFWLDAVVALTRAARLDPGDPDGPPLVEIGADEDETRTQVTRGLGRLLEAEWIVERPSGFAGERELRFAYPTLWESVALGIDEAARRRYHGLIAQWLELRPEGRGAPAQEIIGRHLEEAGDGAGAGACYRRAADDARHRYFNEKAIRLYSRALSCLREGQLAARIHVWHDLGSVYELKGDFEAALGAFEHMLRLSWVVSSRAKAAVAFNKMGRVWRRKGDLKLALEYLLRGQELFEQAEDPRGIAGSLDDVGQVLYLLGRYDEAHAKITEALARRGKGGDKRSIAHSLSNLGNVQKDRGRFAEAENCHQQALELRRQIDDRDGAVLSLNNLAVLAFERGDREAARRGWEQGLAEAERIGALPLQALVLNNLGELALVEGKAEEARRRLEETMGLARDLDDRRLLSESARNLGLLELDGGNAPRARELARRALEIAQASGLRDHVGRALLALGEVHAVTLFDADKTQEHGERPAGAEEFFRRGVELFRELGNEGELAKGLERFGRYKLEHGEVDTGKNLLREAQAIFARLGMKAGEEVTRVIGEL